MREKIKKFIVIDGIVLVLLFLFSSTDLFIQEKPTESYRVAVFADLAAKGQAENFRQGITKASMELNTDMSFLNLAAVGTEREWQEALSKELENGCEGIILQCGDPHFTDVLLAKVPSNLPVVLYNSASASPRVRGRVGNDLKEEGRLAAEAVLEYGRAGDTVLLAEPKHASYMTKEIHKTAEDVLEQAEVPVERVVIAGEEQAEAFVKKLEKEGGKTLFSADTALLQALGTACEKTETELPLFGACYSGSLRNFVERGTITAVTAHRTYEAGYFCMKKMESLLNGSLGKDVTAVETVVVTAENLYDKGIESVVFPYI